MKTRTYLVAMSLALLAFAPATSADEKPAARPAKARATGGIAWYGTWKDALAEATRSQRPILLLSAAPHCRNISGIW